MQGIVIVGLFRNSSVFNMIVDSVEVAKSNHFCRFASGDRDNSYYISLFRRYYNTTPYRYKKEMRK